MNVRQRPAIPKEVKREVRQRCGFGCVICGIPLCEYEHMLEWAAVRRHVASEITLLCPQHHAEKSRGLLPIEDVIKANETPYNLQKGVAKNHFFHYSGNNVQVILGDNIFRYYNLKQDSFFAPLVVDGLAIVGFRVEDDKLLLNFTAFDELNIPFFQIVDNELIHKTSLWDVEWSGQKLTIREGKGRILLQLVFEVPTTIRITKGRILRNGIELIIGKNYIFCSNENAFLSGTDTTNFPVGLSIGDPVLDVQTGAISSGVLRYGIDRVAARKLLRKRLNEMHPKNSSL